MLTFYTFAYKTTFVCDEAVCVSDASRASYVAGYSQPPVPGPAPGKHTNTWNFGVSGDVKSVPPGFKQSTFMVHSLRGLRLGVSSEQKT